MKVSIAVLLLAAVITAVLPACAAPGDAAAPIGEPLPGLTPAELARFRQGETLFNRVFTPEDGLGPLFNENQCSACHTSPATGGTGDQLIVKATRFTPPDLCDTLTAEGGENVRTQATPALRAHGITAQPFPRSATERASFTTTFLFGLGLAELVPAAELERLARRQAARGAVAGRPGRTADGRIGRFGRKADEATLADFTHNALRFEMGLTTSRHASEGDIAGEPYPDGVDLADDPEISDEDVALLVDFMRFLAPPERARPATADERALVRLGEEVFARTGCAGCHVPGMTTPRNPSSALSRKRVYLYSDLLLHDMGPELAGVCGPGATPAELRTAPLMGLRYRTMLLHDGRAHDLVEAIRQHGGQAAAARQRFHGLTELEQNALLGFLRTL
jgi:CxxC motif-containing protein (DUF1111 family)